MRSQANKEPMDLKSKIELLLPSDTNRPARSTARAGVSTSTLAAYRQATLVPNAAIALDLDEALDVHAHLTPQVALNDVLFVNCLADAVDLFFGEVAHPSIRVDVGLRNNMLRGGRPNTKYIGQGNFHSLITRDVYTGNSCHYRLLLSTCELSLPLLMRRVGANNHYYAGAPDNPALGAARLD